MGFFLKYSSSASVLLFTVFFLLCEMILQLRVSYAEGHTRRYNFNIVLKNVTRLCHTKSIVTVNGQFPGPVIRARDGDRVVVKVTNYVPHNITVHWHGVRQLRSGWADGPAYITQCPIQTGHSYAYNFTIMGQRGTLFWHAHISWLRSTVHGPIIILPKRNEAYPFEEPHREMPIILGEWWNSDPEDVIRQALRLGGNANASDAYTINGKPGPSYNCSVDTFKLKVEAQKTYLLRIINAAINVDLFFGIANHTVIVVESDASYTKPFKSDILLVTPGQTVNVLLKTKAIASKATFFIAVSPYATGHGSLDNSTAFGILKYHKSSNLEKTLHNHSLNGSQFSKPVLPLVGSTMHVFNFTSKFHSLRNQSQSPLSFPYKVDKRFFFTVGLGSSPCPQNMTCQGAFGQKLAASINNVSFSLPSTSILQTYYSKQNGGVYTPDFPAHPPFQFNYTGDPSENTMVESGTRVAVLPFNTSVELVLQDTSILGGENHPFHLHGYNFLVVGQGFGNFKQDKDAVGFNLVDPVERNTVGVPFGGWVAIRFLADNPGAWFMHCHFDLHTSWGLSLAWLVLEGSKPDQKLLPPPTDLPKC